MDNMQESVGNQTPVQKPEQVEIRARIVAALIIAVLAIGIIVAIIPGWRAAVLDTFFMSKQERLLQAVNKLGERIPEGERPTEEELLNAVGSLNTEPLTAQASIEALESLKAINR